MSGGDIQRHSDQPGWDEVVGSSWPDDSESKASETAREHLRIASAMGEASQVAGQGRDYATSEMEGEAAEGIATKFGKHAGEFEDRALSHQYTAGWLLELAGAIAAAKNAMNAAAEMHLADHMAPTARGLTKLDPSARTQAQKDASLQAAQAAVQEAAATLASAKSTVAVAIASSQKPMLVPKVPGGPSSVTDGTKFTGQDRVGMPATDPTALSSPGLSTPGLSSPGLTNPGLTNPPPPTLPAGAGGPSAGAGGPSAPAAPPAISPPTLPTESGAGAPAASLSGDSAGGSPTGMGGMPMGGMPMGGGMPMQPPQMPQMPTQTPGADIAKTAGDTIGKFAGGNGGGGAQSLDSATLDKLLDANSSSNDDDGGKLSDGSGVVPASDKSPTGAGGPNGLGHNGAGSTLTNPYSPANANPSLNSPTPLVGPPSPAAATVTPTPPVVSAPVTELSGDESAPPPAHTSAHPTTSISGDPAGPTHNGNNPSGDRQQPPPAVMGGYPAAGGGGLVPPMGAAATPTASPVAGPVMAAGGAAAAAPLLLQANRTADSAQPPTGGGEHLDFGPDRPARSPETVTAHRHLAGVTAAFKERIGQKWNPPALALGVFHYAEAAAAAPVIRYILATADGLSVIPMGVKLPAGIELLGAATERHNRFASEWSGHEQPALKLIAAAEAYPDLLGELSYIVSSKSGDDDSSTNVTAPPAKSRSGVVEVRQDKAEVDALVARGEASPAVVSRSLVDFPIIKPSEGPVAVDTVGRVWGFDDGTPDDLDQATTMLTAARWGGRTASPPDDGAILATYWYVEGRVAASMGRLDDAAYAATQAARVQVAR
ncbi:hypothetical protein [[Mycobacterium] zoologicum]|uniref:hypothetical protein n=1 Tax=[Mycobacterium] zoologicum TaxID=2872311 RepID=UPI002D136C3F|nr:hypothetical protein [Mycolicibacter sp. MYC101]MEB3065514.1 hypothetical protein [Mycolicibacter sp. MYC101]